MTKREELEQVIAHLETQRAILGDAAVDASIAALRQQLPGLGPPPPTDQQRKQVTVLFADVSGFTAMSETMDAEDVTEVMNALWERLDEAIIEHGGFIDKHIGDAVMALWGVETAREDDPEQAIHAALAMQTDLSAFRENRQVDLTMRIGLNTGPVLLGEVGTTGEYTAMGDTVNVASRLEHAAPLGSVLVSHATYRHVRGVFDVQVLEPISIRGKTEPIQVYLVERAKPRAFRKGTRGVEGIETRMIGRDAELKHLQAVFRRVMQDGEHHMVTITGEAGVGKSRLLYEFDIWAEVWPDLFRFFKGRASQEMQHLPYAVIRNLLSFRFQIQDSDPARVVWEKMETGVAFALGEGDQSQMRAHFIGQLLGFGSSDSPHLQGVLADAKQIRDRALMYLGDYFKAMAAQNPILILLEDLHWADESSLDVLNRLALMMSSQPLLIVCTARPSIFERRPDWGQGQAFHTRLALHPLSEEDSRQLVGEILQRAERVPAALRELVVSGAEGNPFYVEELIKMLIEDGMIIRGEGRWRVEPSRLVAMRVPPTLTAVLQARLDGLSPEERTTLQRASVVGRIFWDGTVERISESAGEEVGESEIHPTLSALQGKEMVFQRDTSTFDDTQEYIFKHAILRDVTYESVLKRLRRLYHGLAAEWLIERSGERAGEYTGLIADHLELAGQKKQALLHLHRAGEQAAARFANAEAVRYFSRALELTPEVDWAERYALLLARERVYDLQGAREAQKEDLVALEALAKTSDPERQAEVAYRWGQYFEVVGEYTQAQAAVERAQAAAQERSDIVGEVRCLTQLGLIARRQGDFDRAKAHYNQALVLLEDQEISSDEEALAQARALYLLGGIHRQQGDFEQALGCHERALALNRVSGDRKGQAEVLNGIGATVLYQRRFTEALTYHRQALEMWRAIGDRAGEGRGLYDLAGVSREMGDYGRAQECLSEALAIHQATGDRWEEGNVWNSLGILHQELGDLPRAQSCLERGLQLAQEIGDEEGQAYLLANLGLVARDQGNLEAAGKLLANGLALVQALDSEYQESTFLSYMSTVSLRAGRFEEAVERAERALALRRRLDLRLNTADDLATLAAAYLGDGNTGQAQAYAQEALAILEECGGEGPEFPQRDYSICYRVLAADGQAERACAALQSAYDLVMARADKIADPALRRSFLENVTVHREIMGEWQAMNSE